MTSLFSQFQIAAAYLRTRWLTARLKTRADVTAWQTRQLEPVSYTHLTLPTIRLV